MIVQEMRQQVTQVQLYTVIDDLLINICYMEIIEEGCCFELCAEFHFPPSLIYRPVVLLTQIFSLNKFTIMTNLKVFLVSVQRTSKTSIELSIKINLHQRHKLSWQTAENTLKLEDLNLESFFLDRELVKEQLVISHYLDCVSFLN